ncbi:MAG: oxidoreductase [Candidatus Raymondbacteria bacterium RifOxyA12_full_50_37]|nr:MAG: oxidoreductase [Candidatus Raymondbacteria bacterium RifOxyA12_full_50_37]OGJ87939.1 MAG: oxidoreductase [Candidatus Raymondbacteria bacterium RIFOXYA2_FULL_49_16]OGJ95634.1 MAG: oxidoreductase [Candidatus Raymondbacteria bacterium RIFOXYC2_FULL_50_21]OGK03290.1 MAG: oxidoreductase [Candidatus Raymondbacteria bacterium RifOxyB12_full_50_8]OGP43184.1 MAG: oxidoreductase [Candidatus Raymondbacteria bacterium RIFOXYB2_FULL_49_35]
MATHNNQTAIITGGAQGIGKAIAQRFARNRINVVIADVDAEAGKETEKAVKALGEVRFIQTDVADPVSVKNCVEKTIKKYGAIDILVNNAATSVNKSILQITEEEWNRVIAVNLTGAFLFIKYAAPFLKKTKGAIVNIASTRAVMSERDTEAYSASKGGLVSLTHACAASLGPEIRVNCVSPGWIDVTQWKKISRRETVKLKDADHLQHPAGRVGIPNDVASAVAFLVSSENSFITGTNLVIDGGMTKKMVYV